MERSKKVIFVSHCILNHNTKSVGNVKALDSVKDIVNVLVDSDVGIVQLPCPQIKYNNGLHRKTKTKDYYDKKSYRTSCKKLSLLLLSQIENYMSKNYKVVGILGTEFSPTCGVHQLRNNGKVSPGKGIFMEELETIMKKKRFQIPIVGVDLNNRYSSIKKLESLIQTT